MKRTSPTFQLGLKTADAYSCVRWGSEWVKCCDLLLKTYTPEEAEGILRSKHMRWAADYSVGRYPKLSDFVSYLSKYPISKQAAQELIV